MSERIARLYGPALATPSTSPTTLFTPPTGKLYVLRSIAVTASPVTGGAIPALTLVGGLTNLLVGNRIFGVPVTLDANVVTTSVLNLSMPILETETVVAGYEIAVDAPSRKDWESADDAIWNSIVTTNATSYATTTATPQAGVGNNTYLYIMVVNTKATTPDVINTLTNTYTPPPSTGTSIVTAATAGVRCSIWGSYHTTRPTNATSAWTADFNGVTQTGAAIKVLAITNTPFTTANPSTSNVLYQTVSATGTTELSHGVTMTPSAAANGKSWQLLLVAGEGGVSSSYTAPSNGTEVADGTIATPNMTAAAYFIYPSITNPAAVIANAQTTWSAVCIEGQSGSFLDLVASGIIIE